MTKVAAFLVSLLSLFFLSFGSNSVVLDTSFLKSNVVFAQEELMLKEATGSSEISNEAVEYTLPYPGILPDSPLYFLKATRDRIVGFLISDPLKKAEFNLLVADKRLNSGIFLFNKGKNKYSLVISTVSKGENYFEEAINKTEEAKKQGMDTNDILRRLSDSSNKHLEVLKSFEKTLGKDFKEETVSLRKRIEDLKKRVDLLRLKQ